MLARRIKAISLPLLPIAIAALGFGWTVSASQLSGSATSSQNSAEYRNDHFQFSLDYPADLVVQQQDEQNGAQTISFLPGSGSGKQFEIEAIPSSQIDIGAANYEVRDPFGVADQGLQLRYVNQVADESTVQIWFLKTGVMYEVITMKGDEAWLIDILKTWQFD